MTKTSKDIQTPLSISHLISSSLFLFNAIPFLKCTILTKCPVKPHLLLFPHTLTHTHTHTHTHPPTHSLPLSLSFSFSLSHLHTHTHTHTHSLSRSRERRISR